MKRLVMCFFALTLCFSVYSLEATDVYNESGNVVSKFVEEYDDGSYLEILICEDVSVGARSSSKSGSKKFNYYNNDDELLWTHVQKGTFTYEHGISSQCTSASYSYSINDSSWSLDSGSAWKSGNESKGTATFVKKVLFITTKTKEINTSLKCDVYGNLS